MADAPGAISPIHSGSGGSATHPVNAGARATLSSTTWDRQMDRPTLAALAAGVASGTTTGPAFAWPWLLAAAAVGWLMGRAR